MHSGRLVARSYNGAEFLELHARAVACSTSIPGYVRTCCGFEPRPARSREMAGRAHPVNSLPTQALERRTVTIQVTDAEYATLDAGGTAAGLSNPQYVRTQCGFQVRETSLPRTTQRDHEEDDAWERLKRLGLDPEEYFPPEQEG